tara:strand:+ start:518 stop:1114 length:597 start_codon:yes stop_codon:yes gene_type:complete
VNNVLVEIIDDELNQNVLVYEEQNYFGKIISERGLNVINASLSDSSFFLKNDVDAALIVINLSLFEDTGLAVRILNVLKNANVLNKVYIFIHIDTENDGILNSLKQGIRIKLLEKKIQIFLFKEFNFSECESLYILKDEEKVRQILPKYLIKAFYKRSWKIYSGSFIGSLIKLLNFFITKYLYIYFSNDVLMVFKYEK